MTKFRRGDKVTAVVNIGGVMRQSVPKGTDGVVIEDGWTMQAKVRFSIKSTFGADRRVEVSVSDNEIG